MLKFIGCLAINYKSISELVKDKENGQIFIDKEQLGDQIYAILNEFENGYSSTLEKYRENLSKGFCKQKWEDHWNNSVYEQIIKDNTP